MPDTDFKKRSHKSNPALNTPDVPAASEFDAAPVPVVGFVGDAVDAADAEADGMSG
jgi:hypothetical protein